VILLVSLDLCIFHLSVYLPFYLPLVSFSNSCKEHNKQLWLIPFSHGYLIQWYQWQSLKPETESSEGTGSKTVCPKSNTIFRIRYYTQGNKYIYKLRIPYPKCLGPELFQVSEVFEFWNICIDFINHTSLIQNSEIQNLCVPSELCVTILIIREKTES
jgi:hypothetical protein